MQATATLPPPCFGDGNIVYTVKKLLAVCRRGWNRHYLVEWEGYGPEERSWVSASDILDPGLVKEIHDQHPDELGPPGAVPVRRIKVMCFCHKFILFSFVRPDS